MRFGVFRPEPDRKPREATTGLVGSNSADEVRILGCGLFDGYACLSGPGPSRRRGRAVQAGR